ncbi:hypothetical protein [Frigoriglobus tundricola]|uniref:Uncharacterized protein n=1 Tax=Frigoriglobus tundricola TaxID=2774151 RepID=A0A6M5YQW2_9BACT|nr:hypothetical protein [Frigoriglobus tundricola]QJW95683.1 hypothetical protein FTUN_3237 [Frigoriglobus tundricola]
MYFQKPADALTATGNSDVASGVAQLGGSRSGSAADVQPTTLPPLPPSRYPTTAGSDFASAPPPPQPRYLPPPSGSDFASGAQPAPPRYSAAPGGAPFTSAPAAVAPPVTTTGYDTQSKPGEPGYVPPADKRQNQYKPVDPKYIQLPARSEIFTVYNDAQLERSTVDRLYGDFIKGKEDTLRVKKDDLEKKKAALKDADPDKIKSLKDEVARDEAEIALQEKTLNDLKAVKDPTADQSFRFPPLPVVGPPASAYQPKTVTYAPRKLIVEPGFVAHRKLYLEERNAERAGWDFGPMQTLVSAAYFWKGTLTIPQSFASGFVYGHWDTSAGKCLPGSPSPYYLYPPGLTVTGTVAEGVLITGAGFIFK